MFDQRAHALSQEMPSQGMARAKGIRPNKYDIVLVKGNPGGLKQGNILVRHFTFMIQKVKWEPFTPVGL